MNIYVLDRDPKTCAQYHNNYHCSRMILESIQLLNNALIRCNTNYATRPLFKASHQQHPLVLWTAASRENYQWLLQLGQNLCEEYTFRYLKHHMGQDSIHKLSSTSYLQCIPANGKTPFIKYMPQQYQVDDVVQSYRNYYRGAKSHLAQWRIRETPLWWKETPDLGLPIVSKKKHKTHYSNYARGWERIWGRPPVLEIKRVDLPSVPVVAATQLREPSNNVPPPLSYERDPLWWRDANVEVI